MKITYAGVAELADAPDLGSGGTPVQVQVLSPAPMKSLDFSGLFCFYTAKKNWHTHKLSGASVAKSKLCVG